jgi:hypothetical protein
MQRRSDLGWAAAMDYVKSPATSAKSPSRGINYKARKSIGKIATPVPQTPMAASQPGTVTDRRQRPQAR